MRLNLNFSSDTGYSRISFSSPSRVTVTLTLWRRTLTLVTSPFSLSEVVTKSPTAGSLLFKSSYASSSFLRQHISRPQTPEIFVGLSERFCSFAILIETGINSGIYVAQHNGLPHAPIPPRIFASSLTPICLSSILVLKTEAKSFTSSLKSILPSAVK